MSQRNRVLVVESEGAIAEMYRGLLASDDRPVTLAASLLAAASQFSPGTYALAIVDRELADGPGIEFVRLVRGADPAVRLAMVCSFPSSRAVPEACPLGVEVLIARSLSDVGSLRRVVDLLVEKSQLIDDHAAELDEDAAGPISDRATQLRAPTPTIDGMGPISSLIDLQRRLSLAIEHSASLFAVQPCEVDAAPAGAHAPPAWLLRAAGLADGSASAADGDETLLGRLFELIVEQAGAGSGSLMISEARSSDLTIVHSRGLPAEVVRSARIRLGDAVAGWVADQRQPLLLFERLALDEWARTEGRGLMNLVQRDRSGVPCSAMVIPFAMGGQPIGVLNLNRIEGQQPFSAADLDRTRIYLEALGKVLQHGALRRGQREHAVELSRLQSRLVHAARFSRLLQLGETASEVAHDIKEPLQAIQLIAQNLERDVDRGPIERQRLASETKEIVAMARRISNIVARVRELSRGKAGSARRATDLNRSIDEVVAVFGPQLRERGIGLTVEQQADLPAVRAIPDEMIELLTNLLTNARDALAKRHEPRRIDIRSSHDASVNEVVVAVADTAGGVPQRLRPHIFEPFFTTKATGEGVGLGLSICQRIVSQHGGRIELSVDHGKGSTFSVHLPTGELQRADGTAATRAERP